MRAANVLQTPPMSQTPEFDVLAGLTYEEAAALLNTSMWVTPEPDHGVELRIVDVAKVMESEAAKLNRTPFSISFLGPKSYQIAQGAYPTRHDAFDVPFWLFIVPVAEREDGFVYEAIFT
jgi:hypothetical protein